MHGQRNVKLCILTTMYSHSHSLGHCCFSHAPYFPHCQHLMSLLTYLLTPWSRALLEKLTGFQLVKKFPAFYGTRRFITAVTSARQLSISWAGSIQSIPPHPTSGRSTLILSSHLRLALPSGLFPSGFSTKPFIRLSSPSYVLYAPPISVIILVSVIFCP